jgi:hypothetical protein
MSSHLTASNYSKFGRSSKASSKTSTMRSEKLVFVENQPPKKEKIDPKTISKKELQLKEFEEEQNKKKLKEQLEEKKYRNISVRISKEENILCLSVDGSQTSKDAFEIILTEFLPFIHNSVLICPHIYNGDQDEKFNWRFQKANVLEYYKTRLTTSLADYQGYLIIQDRDANKMHEIEQSYKIAEMNECKYFFCGYEGLREQALKKARIDVGIEYLLGESKIPVIIMKDNKKRGNKNKGFQWLLIMDKSNFDCYRVLDLFLPLIDRQNDKIFGLTLMPHFVQNDEDVKKHFYDKMKELNFKEKEQFEYAAKQYNTDPIKILIEFVNHNSEQFFDFVLFLNNPMKFKAQKQECDTFKYVKLLFANIGFCNYAYIYGYDYKQISKLPSDVDARKYLENFNKKEEEIITKKESNKIIPSVEKKEPEQKIILIDDKKGNEIDEEIYSEIYGVSKGNIFERTSPTKPKECDVKKEEEKKVEKKIQPKNISKSMRVMKKESTWAPTSKKKLGPIGKSLMDPKKVNKANFGSNNAPKKPTVVKKQLVKK